jgi:DNA-binding phage protein
MVYHPTMDKTLNKAAVELIDRLGGLTIVAKAVGVSRQAVLKWRVHGIPPDRVKSLKAVWPRAGWTTTAQGAIGRGKFGPRS